MIKCVKLDKKQEKELEEIVSDVKSNGKEVRRAQAILLLNADTDIEIIKQVTKYKRKNIFRLRRKYLDQGIKAVKCDKKKEPRELLTKKEKEEIIEIVKTKKPKECDEYFSNYEYWTTAVLADFILREYNIQYKSKTSLYIIFRQSKFSYHKPGRVYEKRDEKEVERWKEEANPIIAKGMRDNNTVILCEDEMVLSTQTTFQKIWLPQGEYPKIEVSNKKENRSIYGFLNIKTGAEHAFKSEWQNMYITCDILKEIRKIYPKEKILIVWDGAGWHRGSKVQDFINNDKNIDTVYFPRYSPEENPQEHVWKSGRDKVTHNKFIKNIDNITDEFIDYLNNTKFLYKLLEFSVVS